MSFTLSDIVPWGRSYKEYVDMFMLTGSDIKKSILGCGDGPASFNAELSLLGGNIISIDPIYSFSKDQIKIRIDEVFPEILTQASANKSNFIWSSIPSVEALGKVRMQSMEIFLSDYDQNRHRYLPEKLPLLPFPDKNFDLALCSHLLFLYSDKLDVQFHLQSIKELMRVSSQVRIYPLVDLNAQPSIHLEPICNMLNKINIHYSFQDVDYEFQKGAKLMLKIADDINTA